MKLSKIFCLLLALTMTMSCAAFASGEASGDFNGLTVMEGMPAGMADMVAMGANATAEKAVIAVTSGEIDEDMLYGDDFNGVFEGSFDASGAEGVLIETDDFTANLLCLSGEDTVFTLSNSVLRKGVNEETSGEPAGNGLILTDSTLIVENCLIELSGSSTSADYPVAAYGDSTFVFIDSELYQTGETGAEGLTAFVSRTGGYFAGTARGSFLVNGSKSYFYNSYVEAEGWGALSTDSASGTGLNVYCYGTEAVAAKGGYGIYADTRCFDWLYGSSLKSAEYGAVLTNNGELHLYAGAAAGEDVLAYYPEDAEPVEDGSEIIAGRACVWVHSPDMQGGGSDQYVTVFTAEDSLLATSEEWDEKATLTDYAADFGQGVADYIDFTKGSLFLIFSCSADIDLKNCELSSYSNTILMTSVNNDPMCPRFIKVGGKSIPTVLRMTDMTANGDVKNCDYQRNVEVYLNNTEWNGAAIAWTAEDWDGYWAYAEGMENVNWVNLDEKYDKTTRSNLITLENGSVWMVTGDSQLEKLVIGDDCAVICGTATVDGKEVTLEPGKTYEGDIVLTAAPSDVTWESYIEFLWECFADTAPNPDSLRSLLEATPDWATIEAAIDNGPWYKFFGEKYYDATTWDEFVASGGVGTFKADFEDSADIGIQHEAELAAAASGEAS